MLTIPFSGSKRNYLNLVTHIVEEGGYDTVYEPFGGSAVLSVNLYNSRNVKRAVINDYDRLFDIYPKYLDVKDRIIRECKDYGIEKGNGKSKMTIPQQKFVQSLIEKEDKDLWPLLANNFVFSARVTSGNVHLKDFVYFINDIGTEKQREYLKVVNNLERDSLDYKDFFREHKTEFNEKSLIILDPPYLNSAQKQYKNKTFFGLADTIELLKIVQETNTDFLFFNMIERDTKALLDLYGFNIERFTVKGLSLNYTSKREDVMAYIKQQPLVRPTDALYNIEESNQICFEPLLKH